MDRVWLESEFMQARAGSARGISRPVWLEMNARVEPSSFSTRGKHQRRLCIFGDVSCVLILLIHGETEGLYRQYKDLSSTSPLLEILPEELIQQWSSGPLCSPHFTSSYPLLSDHFWPCMRILIYSMKIGYTHPSPLIHNE